MHYKILRAVNIHVIQKRFFKKDHVRVRFAPSPTGQLHLGGLRTALYNYLFARASNGTFILRIEDTDQVRIVAGALEKIQNDLLWAGIIPDEDPTRGGPAGPYVQSKRLELYKEQVQKLLENKSAYYCFCSEKRLDLLRKEAIKCGQIPKYDNRCRHLSNDEIKEQFRKTDQYCIRFKLSSTTEPFDDMIYGNIVHAIEQTEGDPVIVKSDGYPTYHFANVVDDHFMEISHVFRGIEWQISTPKHIMLYKAFGWTPPLYGHLPLILNADGTKLSKRQGDIQVEEFRKNGIFPLALLNYVTHAGGGFDEKEANSYLDSYQKLIKQFNISKIKPSSSKLSPERLLEFNKFEISRLLANEKNNKLFVERVGKLVLETFPDRKTDGSLQLDEQHIITTLKWGRDRINKLNDLVSPDLAFLWIVPAIPSNIRESGNLDIIKNVQKMLSEIEADSFNKVLIAQNLRDFASNNEIQFPRVMRILRSILSGAKEGPPVAEMIEILGKDRTLSRINRCLS